MSDNLFIVFSDSVFSRHQFDDLMRDIGIVNETVMDNLWAHVELTVEKDKMSDDEAESMNHKMKKIEAENQSLRVQLAAQSEKMKAIQSILTPISAAIAHAGDIPAHKPHSETERLLAVPRGFVRKESAALAMLELYLSGKKRREIRKWI